MSKYKYHQDRSLPKHDEIFVFGSNLAGRHGAGAALIARNKFGACYGVGCGRTGNAYALPTKDIELNTLPLERIRREIKRFREHTKKNKGEIYFITRIACGLAGYEDSEVAPLFRGATRRCNFPIEWKEFLE